MSPISSFSLFISVDLLLSEAIIYFYLQDNYVDRHSVKVYNYCNYATFCKQVLR